jgi:hypothetical protein
LIIKAYNQANETNIVIKNENIALAEKLLIISIIPFSIGILKYLTVFSKDFGI